jgi:hypothetical protein
LCTGCAGGLGDFTCPACGREGILYRRGACGNCVLAEMLAALLDDGTGRIRPELAPFASAFGQMKRPRGGITWIRRPHVREMLRTLAEPGTPVTHETLSVMSPWRHPAWWGSDPKHTQSVWLDAGYTAGPNLTARKVTFTKVQ